MGADGNTIYASKSQGTTPPSFSAYARSPSSPHEDQAFQANVTLSETPNTVLLQVDNGTKTNYTVTTNNGLEYYFTVGVGNYTAHDVISYQWYANDSAGNGNWSTNQSFTVSNQLPTTPSLTAPANTTISNNSVVGVAWTSTDADAEDTVTSWVFSDGVVNKSVSGLSTTITYADGAHNVQVLATDTYGNTSLSTARYFTVDTIAPTITVTSPGNTSYLNLTVGLNVSSPDANVDAWWYSLNGGANTTFTPNTTVTAVSGPNNIRVSVNDTGGNMGTTTVYFTVSLPYNLTSPLNQTYYVNDIWVNLTQADAASLSSATAELDGTTNQSLTNSSGNWNYLWSDIADGGHTIRLYVNSTDGRHNNTVTIGFTVNTGVVISSPLNTTYTSPHVALDAYTVAADGIDAWLYQRDGGANTSWTPNITVSGLLPGAHSIVIWGNLSGDGTWKTDSVSFTVSYRQGSFTWQPPTPASQAQAEAYGPVTIRLRLFNASVVNWTAPVLFFLVNDTVGTYGMNYLGGGLNNVTYERTLTLPPGDYVYWARAQDETGAAHVSGNQSIGVYSRLVGGLPLVAVFTGSTPRSHDTVFRTDGISVQGRVENINGSLGNATLYLINQDGSQTLATADLAWSLNNDSSASLWGSIAVPEGVTSVYVQLGVTDDTGTTAYSVRREVNAVDNDEDNVIGSSLGLFTSALPDERGSPEIGRGRLLAATITGLALMGAAFVSGAGAVPAVGIGALAGIEFSLYGVVPGYVSIILVLLLAVLAAKGALNIFGSR